MPAEQPQVSVHPDRLATEFLANERTFLAWVRTSIAVITLGFLVAKFGIWLRELGVRLAPQTPASQTSTSLYAGVALMVFGGVLAVLAARRYHVVNRAIERGEVAPDRGLVILITSFIALLSAGLIAYLVLTTP